MKIKDVLLESHRSIDEQRIELDGLCVLTGENPIMVADALDGVLWLLNNGVPTPFDLERNRHSLDTPGVIRYELEAVTVPGSADAEIARRILAGFVDELSANELAEMPLDPKRVGAIFLQHSFGEEFDGPGDEGRVARALGRALRYVVSGFGVGFSWDLDDLSSDERESIFRLHASIDEASYAIEATVEDLVVSGSASLYDLDGACLMGEPVVNVMFPDHDLGAVVGEVADAMSFMAVPLANVMLHNDVGDYLDKAMAKGRWLVSLEELDRYELAAEGRTTEGTDHRVVHPRRGAVDEAAAAAAVAVDPAIIRAADILGRRATELAPSFLRDLGAIRVRVIPPVLWMADRDRIQIVVAGHDGTVRTLGELDRGTERFVTIALRLAIDDVRAAVDGSASEVNLDDHVHAAFAATPLDENLQWLDEQFVDSDVDFVDPFADGPTLRLLAGNARRAIILRSPEADLPWPVAPSIARWLEQLGRAHLSVVVTTFSPDIAGADGHVHRFD